MKKEKKKQNIHHIHIIVDDDEYKRLKKSKEKTDSDTWRDLFCLYSMEYTDANS